MNHPFFSRVYPRFALEADKRGQAQHRAELLTGTSGRVVEIGAGTGRNFSHYPTTVAEVMAVEPEPRLRRLAEVEAATLSVPVRVRDEQLPKQPRRQPARRLVSDDDPIRARLPNPCDRPLSHGVSALPSPWDDQSQWCPNRWKVRDRLGRSACSLGGHNGSEARAKCRTGAATA